MAVVAALGAAGGGGVDQEEMDRIKADMEAEIRKNEEEMEEMKRSWEEKMKEQEKEYQVQLHALALLGGENKGVREGIPGTVA